MVGAVLTAVLAVVLPFKLKLMPPHGLIHWGTFMDFPIQPQEWSTRRYEDDSVWRTPQFDPNDPGAPGLGGPPPPSSPSKSEDANEWNFSDEEWTVF